MYLRNNGALHNKFRKNSKNSPVWVRKMASGQERLLALGCKVGMGNGTPAILDVRFSWRPKYLVWVELLFYISVVFYCDRQVC